MKRKMEEIVLYGWQPIQTSSARKLMVLQEKMYDSIVPLFVKPSASLPQVLPSYLRQVPPHVGVRDVVREKEANHQEKEEVNQKGKDQEKEEANLKRKDQEKEEVNQKGKDQEKEEANLKEKEETNLKGKDQEKEEANLKGKDQEKEDPAARMQERDNHTYYSKEIQNLSLMTYDYLAN